MRCYAVENFAPGVNVRTYSHPSMVLRGEFGRIILQQGSNVMDTCLVHGFPRKDCVVEASGHVARGAELHGCRIECNGMIDMNVIIMGYVVIGWDSIVAATALIKAKFECTPRSLVIGSFERVKRILTDDEGV